MKHFHVPLDLAPTWGQVLGLGMERREISWIQPGNWWQIIVCAYSGVLTANGTPLPFSPGAVLIIQPSARCHLEGHDQIDITHHWFKFRPNPAGEVLLALPQVAQLGANYAYVRDEIISGLDFMPVSRSRIDSISRQILWTVSKNPLVNPEHPILNEIEHFIRENLSSQMKVSELAHRFEISTTQLNRLFSDHFNQSPSEFIRSSRMQLACGLLLKTNKPIKEVALLCGYVDLQRFNKVVREVLGCSPRQIRVDRPEPRLMVDTQSPELQAEAAALAEAPKDYS